MSPDDRRIAEAARLAEQHEYITSGLGFLIHPIEHHIKDHEGPIRIADISEGLQFLSDTDVRWPKCPIEVTRVPIKEIVKPDGVKDSAGTFHMVAVRLAHLTIGNANWNVAIKIMISLLRPGGWIQWTDWDPRTARIAGVKPGAEDKALRDLLHRFSDLLKEKEVGSTYRISASIAEAGLREDDNDLYPLPPDVGLTRNIANGALRQLELAGHFKDGQLERLETEVENEINAGNSLAWYDLWCHIARKPKQP